MGADDDADAACLEVRLDRIRDLPRHPLLDLEALREAVDEPREFADADDFSRQIADARRSVKRQQMMLAGRVERDAAEDDQLITRFFKRARKDLGRIIAIAGGHLAPRFDHPRGRIGEPFARRILADESQERRHRFFSFSCISEVKYRRSYAHNTQYCTSSFLHKSSAGRGWLLSPGSWRLESAFFNRRGPRLLLGQSRN